MSNAAVVYTSLVVHLGLNIVSTEHLSSEDNWSTDRLSRHCSVADLAVVDSKLQSMKEVRLNFDIAAVLSACNPSRPLLSDADFIALWNDTQLLCTELKSL